MSTQGLLAEVVRLDPDAALAPDPDRPGELVSLQYVGDDDRLVAGTWSAGAGTVHIDAYPVDEICVVIEGSITVETSTNGSETFHPGDAFAIRRGAALTWSQTEGTKKFYVILNNG
jgi:uncharacterized cupin superfamily protein